MRVGFVALVAEKAAVRPHDDVVLQVLTVLGGAQAIGLTSEELQAGMFRVKAWAWFRKSLVDVYQPSLIQGAAVQVPSRGS